MDVLFGLLRTTVKRNKTIMEAYINWGIPYKYIRHYLFLMMVIFFAIPLLLGLRYTLPGYIVNYLWADFFFFKWCQVKIREDKARKRKEDFLGKDL